MSKELDEKWAELVANGRAEWVPGMLVRARRTELAFRIVGAWLVEETKNTGWNTDPSILPLRRNLIGRPDWSDPATLGALVGQVEARHGAPVSVSYFGERRRCTVRFSADRYWDGATKAASLLDALEAAP